MSIHAFWLVALAAADRMAISPLPPICSEISSSCLAAMPSAVAWLMNRSRQSGLVSASKVIDLDVGAAGLVDRVAQGLGVVGRQDQGVLALLGDGVDVGHLGVGAGGLGADLLDLGTELLGRRLGTGGAGVEVRVAEVLRQHRHAELAAAIAAAVGAAVAAVVAAARGERRGGGEDDRSQCDRPPGVELHLGSAFRVPRRRRMRRSGWGSTPEESLPCGATSTRSTQGRWGGSPRPRAAGRR